LANITSVCVDRLAGPVAVAEAGREMAFAALFAAKRFVLLEKCEKADATIKGAVLDSVDQRSRSESEGMSFGAVAGAGSVGPTGGSAGFGGVSGSAAESLASSETRRHASVTLRLVNADGRVLWAYTQDSAGGKTKGAVADAVDRAIRQLLRETARTDTSK
jgi:hypothetical protein